MDAVNMASHGMISGDEPLCLASSGYISRELNIQELFLRRVSVEGLIPFQNIDGGSAFMILKHYVGEVGTPIIVYVGQDMSTASVIKLLVFKPNGLREEWTAEAYAIDGKYNYVVHYLDSGEFDRPGTYKFQVYTEIGSWKGRGQAVPVEIYEEFS